MAGCEDDGCIPVQRNPHGWYKRAVVTGTLSGYVQGNGAPVANAQVRVKGTVFAGSTDSSGAFALNNVPAGSGYAVTVAAAGFASKQVPGVTVSAGTTDLGNALSVLPGPACAFYDFVDTTLEPIFLGSDLRAIEGDAQAGYYGAGTLDLGLSSGQQVEVAIDASAPSETDAITGYAASFGAGNETASVLGLATSASAGVGVFCDTNVVVAPGQYVSYAVTAVASSGASSSPASALILIAAPTLTEPAILADGSVQFNLSGIAGLSYTVQASTNLVDWVPMLGFVSTNGTTTVVDPAVANLSYRFYRASSP